jgi:hypothetical protein
VDDRKFLKADSKTGCPTGHLVVTDCSTQGEQVERASVCELQPWTLNV